MAYQREIPLYTLEGVRDADVSYHPFSTEDMLGLHLHRGARQDPPAEALAEVLRCLISRNVRGHAGGCETEPRGGTAAQKTGTPREHEEQ